VIEQAKSGRPSIYRADIWAALTEINARSEETEQEAAITAALSETAA
jgi:hypothetical protein